MSVDTELQRREAAGQPVRIGLVGAGRTARMILIAAKKHLVLVNAELDSTLGPILKARAGEVLDGLGGFCAYGVVDNAVVARRDGLLPMDLTDGAVLLRDVRKDEPILASNVALPEGRVSVRLRAEQDARFGINVLSPSL